MAVSKRLRHEVMRRDNHTCRYCGGTAPDVKLTIDHVTPVALGGQDVPENLVTACADCNAGKAASNPDAPLVAEVNEKALEWSKAMSVAMDRRMAAFTADHARVEAFDRQWAQWCDAPREPAWRDSVRRFIALGLSDEFIANAVESAMGNRRVRLNDVWRYFCGICWTEVRAAQEEVAAQRDAMPPEQSAPVLQSLTEPFDYMILLDDFTELLTDCLGGDGRVQNYVSRHLWEAIPAAHKAWAERLREASIPLSDDQGTLEEAATDAARDAMREYLTDPASVIRQWHGTVYGPKRAAQYEDDQAATDGS